MGLAAINKNMDRVMKKALRFGVESDDAKIIIFSDHHRGLKDGADDFVNCEQIYLKALEHYNMKGFTLVLLGDVEEFWECVPALVMKKYKDVLGSETQFYKDARLVKIWGNHDDQWQEALFRMATLPRSLKDLRVYEGLVIELKDEKSNKEIELVLTHGHQGTLSSDKFAGISRWFVRWFWRPIQQVFKIKLNATPATSMELQSKHDRDMYRWAQSRENTILICGHTHHPVFMSDTHLDDLLAKKKADSQAVSDAEIEKIKKVSTQLKVDKKTPCYFNTGCCSFEDGDITGIEIEGGEVRLIKWDMESGREIKRKESLSKLFELLG